MTENTTNTLEQAVLDNDVEAVRQQVEQLSWQARLNGFDDIKDHYATIPREPKKYKAFAEGVLEAIAKGDKFVKSILYQNDSQPLPKEYASQLIQEATHVLEARPGPRRGFWNTDTRIANDIVSMVVANSLFDVTMHPLQKFKVIQNMAMGYRGIEEQEQRAAQSFWHDYNVFIDAINSLREKGNIGAEFLMNEKALMMETNRVAYNAMALSPFNRDRDYLVATHVNVGAPSINDMLVTHPDAKPNDNCYLFRSRNVLLGVQLPQAITEVWPEDESPHTPYSESLRKRELQIALTRTALDQGVALPPASWTLESKLVEVPEQINSMQRYTRRVPMITKHTETSYE